MTRNALYSERKIHLISKPIHLDEHVKIIKYCLINDREHNQNNERIGQYLISDFPILALNMDKMM